MRQILFLIIFLVKISVIGYSQEQEPPIDSTKYFIIDKDTLNVFSFWKENRPNTSIERSESKFFIKSKEWKGGEFFIEINKDKNKIILQEVINPWRPDESIINQIETEEIEFQLGHVKELGYWDNKIWFSAFKSDFSMHIWYPPSIIGFFDLSLNSVKLYYPEQYYPKDWNIHKGVFWTYYYKGKVIFYMDGARSWQPTKTVKVMIWNGEFKPIEIK